MSDENVEIVRRVMQCFADQDVEAALADIHPQAILDWSNSDALDSGVYMGHAGWRAFMQGRDEALRERRFDSVELLTPAADTVVVSGRVREQGRASGIEVETYGAVICELREGKIVRFKIYQSRDEALTAVGLT
jgi:ketosteroid isomerase-like protein